MQSQVNSKSSLQVIAKIKDNIPDGIAASITVTLYCKSTSPKKETIINAMKWEKWNVWAKLNELSSQIQEAQIYWEDKR